MFLAPFAPSRELLLSLFKKFTFEVCMVCVSAVARAAISLTYPARGHTVHASYFNHLMLDVIQEYFLVTFERRLLQRAK